MKPERRVAGLGDVLGVLDADDPEVGLLPRGAEDLAGREELAAVQPAGEVEDARALHDGVVDVEERRRRRVGRVVERGLDLGRGGRGLAGQRRALLQVAAAADGPGGVTSVRLVASQCRDGAVACGSIRPWQDRRPCPAHRRRATCWRAAADESPDRLALVEAGGRGMTWAELDDEVGRLATGLAPPGSWPGTG